MELLLLVGISRNNKMKNVHVLKSAFWCKLVRRYKQRHAPMYHSIHINPSIIVVDR